MSGCLSLYSRIETIHAARNSAFSGSDIPRDAWNIHRRIGNGCTDDLVPQFKVVLTEA